MAYDWHVDGALVGEVDPVRSDISVTLFLGNPQDYDGGELAIQTQGTTLMVKLPAGAAVAYDSTTLHRVQQVTRGVRLAAVTWVQSRVRDEAMRTILYEIGVVRNRLGQLNLGSQEAGILAKAYANLMRKVVEE